jgi:hypothetical protein
VGTYRDWNGRKVKTQCLHDDDDDDTDVMESKI